MANRQKDMGTKKKCLKIKKTTEKIEHTSSLSLKLNEPTYTFTAYCVHSQNHTFTESEKKLVKVEASRKSL